MTSVAAGATFDVVPLRVNFVAHDAMHFAPGTIGNLLRGSIGKNLKRLSCTPACIDTGSCSQRDTCAYARWFEPASNAGPSGLHDLPRPFVLRCAHLDGASVRPGETFHAGLNLFETSEPAVDVFSRALASFAPIESVAGTVPLRLPLASARDVTGVRVRFVTPTELKGYERPEFGALFARIRDRVSTLRGLYGAGPIAVDFKAMGERATQVRTTRCEIRNVDAERVSRSTGQRHSLRGFVGVAEYEGDLSEFVPYLKIARWTGVGRQTVWGKGEIDCEAF